MVLGARLRTVMSSIIRWRKAEILPAGGIEYAEGLVLLIASNGTGKRRPTPSWRSSNQVSVRLAGRGKRTPGPGQRRANSTGRVSTLRHIMAFHSEHWIALRPCEMPVSLRGARKE